MGEARRNGALGLYLHIPFCASICDYCNFNRGLSDPELETRYVETLEREIASRATGQTADTIYFGGGTPSLLPTRVVGRLITACRRAFHVSHAAEITLEVNPEHASPAHLDGLRAAGVNRLSLGVQSFRDAELQRLGRTHDAGRALEAYGSARRAGFENISLDLMLWLPQQTVADARESVDTLCDLRPEHASLYLLEVYPNAPLREAMARHRWSRVPEDDAAEIYLDAFERLEAVGYEHYEISNVAQPGRRSRHNLKYWTDGEWLGFGCGAHSTRDGVRWQNVAGTADYATRVESDMDPTASRRVLTPQQRVEEALFTGLRLADGIDLTWMGRRHGIDLWRRYAEALSPYADGGLVVREADRLKLTRRGMLLANEVMSVFV